MRPVEFGEAAHAGTRLTLLSADKSDAVFGTPEAQAAVQVEDRYPLADHPDLYRLLLSYDVALL